MKGQLPFGNTEFWVLEVALFGVLLASLATEMSYSAPSEIQGSLPALLGLRVGHRFDYYGRAQQKVTGGEMIAAAGRQLLPMALGVRTERLS